MRWEWRPIERWWEYANRLRWSSIKKSETWILALILNVCIKKKKGKVWLDNAMISWVWLSTKVNLNMWPDPSHEPWAQLTNWHGSQVGNFDNTRLDVAYYFKLGSYKINIQYAVADLPWVQRLEPPSQLSSILFNLNLKILDCIFYLSSLCFYYFTDKWDTTPIYKRESYELKQGIFLGFF